MGAQASLSLTFRNPYNSYINQRQYNVADENAIPIGFVKNYNIFANNIQDYNTRLLPIIYEDSIPMRGSNHELTTLSERILLYEYVKNNLVSYEEGEEGCMNSNGGINLMRQLKYLTAVLTQNISPYSFIFKTALSTSSYSLNCDLL